MASNLLFSKTSSLAVCITQSPTPEIIIMVISTKLFDRFYANSSFGSDSQILVEPNSEFFQFLSMSLKSFPSLFSWVINKSVVRISSNKPWSTQFWWILSINSFISRPIWLYFLRSYEKINYFPMKILVELKRSNYFSSLGFTCYNHFWQLMKVFGMKR